MNESLPLFARQATGVGIAEDETDGSEEVALTRAIATDYDIELW